MRAEPVFPDLEEKLMILPSFSAFMVASAACEHQTVPLMLILFILSSRSGVISSKGCWSTAPATLARANTSPRVFAMSSKQANTAALSVMSTT